MKREKKTKEREKKAHEANSRKQLANVRVIQRNLVYVTNLSLNSAKEEVCALAS
jgi:CCR4-NOT transcription complex subunit 4